jgi:hypothetical protein
MPCKYFAPNGQPSKLFEGLFTHYYDREGYDSKKAEISAVKDWLQARDPKFREQFAGDEVTDENGEVKLEYVVKLEDYERSIQAADRLKGVGDTYQLLRSMLKDSSFQKIARAVLLTARKPITVEMYDGTKTAGTIAYNRETNKIYVSDQLSQNDMGLDKALLATTMEAYLGNEVNSTHDQAKQLQGIYASAHKIATIRGFSNKAFDSIASFYSSIFTDSALQEQLKGMNMPGSGMSMWQNVLNTIADTFDMRASYVKGLDDILSSNPKNLEQNRPIVSPYSAEAPVEEETETKSIKNLINPNAPYAGMLTGEPVVDKYIAITFDKLQALRSRIERKAKPAENQHLKAEIRKYDRRLKDLMEHRTVTMLLNVGQREVQQLDQMLDMDISIKEAGENYKLAEGWSELSSLIDTSDLPTSTEKQIREVSEHAMRLMAKYEEKYLSTLKHELLEQGTPVNSVESIDPDLVSEDVGQMTAEFVGLSFGSHPLEIAADYLIRVSAFHTNKAIASFNDRLKDQLKELGSSDIMFMFEKDKEGRYRPKTAYRAELYEKLSELNSDIRKFNKERAPYYQQLTELSTRYFEALGSGDQVAAERINAERAELQKKIDESKEKTKSWDTLNEFMRNNFTYKLSDEGRKANEEALEDLKNDYKSFDPVTGEEVFDNRGYERAAKNYDLEAFDQWLQDGKVYPRLAAQFYSITPNDQWKNTSFDQMTQKQKGFYDFFVKEFIDAQANIPMDFGFTEYNSDRLLREFAFMESETVGHMKKLGKDVLDFFKDIATVKYQESKLSADQVAPFSKDPVKMMRFKGVRQFIAAESDYYTEGVELPAYLKKGLDEGRYKYKNGYLVSALKEKLIQRPVQTESDPLKIFQNFKKFSLAYEYKKEVEDTLHAVKEMAANSAIQPQKDKGISNLMGLKRGQKKGSNLEKRLSYNVDAYLTGRLKDPLVPDDQGKPGERVFSASKALESLNNFTRARQLGLNLASGVTNLVQGTMANFMFAARDEFFNEMELNRAYYVLKSSVAKWASIGQVKTDDAKKIALLIKEFNLLNHLHENFYLDKEWMEKVFEKLYLWQSGGEYLNQGAVMLAMLMRTNLQTSDGKPYLSSGKKVSLWDAYEVKDNKLVLKHTDSDMADDKRVFAVRSGIEKAVKIIHGDYDILNPMMMKKKLAGRVLMMFRTWLPQAVRQRLGQRERDYQLSEYLGKDYYTEGRWRTLGRGLFRTGSIKDDAANIGKFLAAALATTFSNKLGRKVVDTMKISSQDRANMYANVKELWFLSVLAFATLAIKGMISGDDDDDDPVEKSWLTYMYNQTSRVESELWFFYSPRSLSQIVRDAVPLVGTLRQAWRTIDAAENLVFHPDKDVYQRGFRKGHSKFWTQSQMMFPVLNQKQSIWSMWSQLYSDKFR